MAKDVED